MAREVIEILGGGRDVTDSNGDVKPRADFIDASGNTIELPDDFEAAGVAVAEQLLAASNSEAQSTTPEPTPLERAQAEWDARFDEFDDKAPSTDVARSRMLEKFGPRPEFDTQHDLGAAAIAGTSLREPLAQDEPAVDPATARKYVDQFKADQLQRELDAVDANPRVPSYQKQAEKDLILARHRAREDRRRAELDRK